MKLKAVSLVSTSSCCPSQWEGHIDDGRMFYGRYRGGWLSLDVSQYPTDDVLDAIGGERPSVLGRHIGDYADGTMTTKDFISHVEHLIDFPRSIR